jgi:hypothetical protein
VNESVSAVEWATVSALATAGGTLILAIATFASVRSANRAARTAERAFQVGMRPLLGTSRLTDGDIKMGWVDDHRAHVGGGRASIEVVDDRIYLAMSLRNVGSGIAVLQAWHVETDLARLGDQDWFPRTEDFRRQTRDLYIAAGDMGFWQAAIRDPTDLLYEPLRSIIEERQRFLIAILYSNDEGDQRAIAQFVVTPPSDDSTQWLCAVGRHRNLDRANPR